MRTPRWLAGALLLVMPLHVIADSRGVEGLPPHPRLLATAADWEQLASRIADEPDLAAYHARLVDEARRVIPLAPVERVMTGRRLLHVTREMMRRVLLLSYAWRTTREEAFARRAEREMIAVARFTDWNPTHFLDVAEAVAGLALGYDWLHEVLDEKVRNEVRAAILQKGIVPGLDPEASHNAWHRRENNWNQVCFGGLVLGALAIGEEHPDEAQRLLALAREGIVHGLKPYAPDGVYPEGPSYWGYGTSYQVLLVAALESALGTDWGIREAPGFLASAGAVIQMIGATGKTWNFSDNRERPDAEPSVLWFARALDQPALGFFARRILADPQEHLLDAEVNRHAVLAALWWPRPGSASAFPALPRDWHGEGEVPLVVFREAWGDAAAAYFGAKGGAANASHGHMDAGSFVYEVDGVRWAIDLGHQSYHSLESKGIDLWGKGQESERWTIYRLNNFSHNTLTLGGRLHRVDGRASVERFVSEGDRRLAILDLSPVFGDQARRVRRGFRMLEDRGFVVQDEIEGLAAGTTIRWQMATRAAIELQGATAVLRQEGRIVTARLLSPPGAIFVAGPANPPKNDYDAPNPGVSLLGIDLVASDAPVTTVTIRLSPGESPGADVGLGSLSRW